MLSRVVRTSSFILALTSATALTTTSDAALTSIGTPAVSFSAVGPAGMTIVGTTPDLSVAENAGDIAVSVPLVHLTTGISLRDDHMRQKYLEVQTYPVAVLHVARSALTFPGGSATAGAATGTLTLHGVTRSLPFTYSASRGADASYSVAAKAALDMRDFNITVPSYLGVTVKPNVTLDVRFVAKE
jgi:polyisoprenoid-binding protein YceI